MERIGLRVERRRARGGDGGADVAGEGESKYRLSVSQNSFGEPHT